MPYPACLKPSEITSDDTAHLLALWFPATYKARSHPPDCKNEGGRSVGMYRKKSQHREALALHVANSPAMR